VDEREAIAAAVATDERLARLRRELRQRLPELEAQELDGLYLRWSSTEFRALVGSAPPIRTVVAVGIRGRRQDSDIEELLRHAASLLEGEVR
jgi:hypothetical protein